MDMDAKINYYYMLKPTQSTPTQATPTQSCEIVGELNLIFFTRAVHHLTIVIDTLIIKTGLVEVYLVIDQNLSKSVRPRSGRSLSKYQIGKTLLELF